MRQAIQKYEQALGLLKVLGARQWEAATLNHLAEIYTELGEKQSALDYFTQALPLYRSTEEHSK